MSETTEKSETAGPGPGLELGREHCNGLMIDEVIADARCQNCGDPVSGEFCAACGQAKITQRLSFRKLLWEIPNRFLNLDRGLLHTFVNMFYRPGPMARDYVYGQRKKYVNPIGYFIFGASLQLLSFLSSGPVLRGIISTSIEDGVRKGTIPEDSVKSLNRFFGPDLATGLTDVYMVAIAQAYTYVALICFALPLAIFLKLLQGAAGSRYRLAEHMVFSTYVVAQLLVITAFTTPVMIRINTLTQTVSGPMIYIAFTLYAQTGFYPKGLKHISLTLVALLGSMILFFASIFGVFMVASVVHVLLQAR